MVTQELEDLLASVRQQRACAWCNDITPNLHIQDQDFELCDDCHDSNNR